MNALFVPHGAPNAALDPCVPVFEGDAKTFQRSQRRRRSAFLGASCGVSQVASPLPSVPRTLGRSRPERPVSSARLNGRGWAASDHWHRPATGWRPRRRPRLQVQVREDLLDHRLLQGRRNGLHLARAVRAVLRVEVEHSPEQTGPAQPHRLVVRQVDVPREGNALVLNEELQVGGGQVAVKLPWKPRGSM